MVWYVLAMVCNLASGVVFTLVWLHWPERYK